MFVTAVAAKAYVRRFYRHRPGVPNAGRAVKQRIFLALKCRNV